MAGDRYTRDEPKLLARVVDYYLNRSRDFNGLSFNGDPDLETVKVAADLVRSGLLQVMTEQDWMNPHIRPWPSRRTTESQVESLTSGRLFCLYPTDLALANV